MSLSPRLRRRRCRHSALLGLSTVDASPSVLARRLALVLSTALSWSWLAVPPILAQEPGAGQGRQTGAPEATVQRAAARGAVLVLAIGVIDGELSTHEISGVPEGPPRRNPQWLTVTGLEQPIGVTAGILEAEQQVVEVHLYRAEDEIFARLLIEPNIAGHADLEALSLIVHLQGIRGSAGGA